MKNECEKHIKNCDAFCCKYVKVLMSGELIEETKLWMFLHGIKKNKDFYYIPCQCKWFVKNGNFCWNYLGRPIDCKVFNCLYLGGTDVLLH